MSSVLTGMSLSEADIQACISGTAHTPEVSSECSPLMRRTREDLIEMVWRKMPKITKGIDSRWKSACLKLQAAIERKDPAEVIRKQFLWLRPSILFGKIINRLMGIVHRKTREIYDDRKLSDDEKEKLSTNVMRSLVDEMSFLAHLSTSPSFSRYTGKWWADLLSMNATIAERLKTRYDETIQYISTIVDATLFGLSPHYEFYEKIRIDDNFLKGIKAFMDTEFNYAECSYSYVFQGEGTLNIPQVAVRAILTLAPLHVPGKVKELTLREKEGVLEISGTLKRNSKMPVGDLTITDLANHSYVGSADASSFLSWLTNSVPHMISFRTENDRFIFGIRSE